MTLEITQIVDKTKPFMRTVFAWLGVPDARTLEYHFSDGTVLAPYPKSSFIPEWSYLIKGCTDPTGARWVPYMALVRDTWQSARKRSKYKPGSTLNGKELTGPFTCRAHNPLLDRITYYQGPLNSDPARWPNPYRDAYLENH